MEVRPARDTDAWGIAQVQVRAWQVAYRGLVDDQHLDRLSAGGEAPFWTELLRAAASRVWVASDREAVVGFCALAVPARDADLGPGSVEIAALYVHPEQWREGIGSLLLETALGSADGAQVVLWVFRDNRRAQAFYRQHGLAPDGATRTQDGDEVRMRRHSSPLG